MNKSELKKYIQNTEIILGKDWLDKATSEPQDISSYYKKLRGFYHRMHSPDGAMHFPIKDLENGSSHKEGLMYHVLYLDKIIKKNLYKKVVELGCGVGFNIIELASLNPDCQFVGMDLTPANLKIARQRAKEKGVRNAQFVEANFDTNIPIEQVDLFFGIEALCHSKDIQFVFEQVINKLNENGKMIIFDGYGTEKSREADEWDIKAADYFSKGFFLPSPQYLKDVTLAAKESGFEQVHFTDFTKNILSNFDRFKDGVKKVYQFPRITRFLIRFRILPIEVFRHCLAGLYGPHLLEEDYAVYAKLEMDK